MAKRANMKTLNNAGNVLMPTIQKTLKILEFIRVYQLANLQAPTLRCIGDRFGMRSVASAHRHIAIMQSRGWIKRAPYDRNVYVIKQERRAA